MCMYVLQGPAVMAVKLVVNTILIKFLQTKRQSWQISEIKVRNHNKSFNVT